MFEILAVLFVLVGIVSSVLQAAQKGKQAGTGFPPPIRNEARKIEIDEDKRLSQSPKPVRKGSYKSVSKKTEETELVEQEARPVVMPIPVQAGIDTDSQHDEISIDRKSLLNGVIFSVILSPPKCKGMKSIL